MFQKQRQVRVSASASHLFGAGIATLACFALTLTAAGAAIPPRPAPPQDPVTDQRTPVIDLTGPTVIAFWTVPRSNADLEANQLLAMALDQQQYYWSETRDSLEAIGVRPVDQPGLAFTLRDPTGQRTFNAHADSSDIGYALVAPGQPIRVLYRLRYPHELIAEARSYFGEPADLAGRQISPPAPAAPASTRSEATPTDHVLPAFEQIVQTPVASWLPLYPEISLARLENENRVAELCANVDSVERGTCYERALAPSIDFYPLHVAPDSASNRVGELVVSATPGRGFHAHFRPTGSNELVPFTPDLYLQDWGYGPYFHQTVVERQGGWFRLPRRPWPGPVWIHRTDQLERSSLQQVYVGEILDLRGEGWVVVEIRPDALMMRPEQEADMWCDPSDPPPLVPTEPTRFTHEQLVDEDGHLIIRPKYMKGC